jgi:mannose-1-phosphate guanylyltransferase/phosphomannomutase
LVHIYANSDDREWVDENLRKYRTYVQEFVEQDSGVEAPKAEALL